MIFVILLLKTIQRSLNDQFKSKCITREHQLTGQNISMLAYCSELTYSLISHLYKSFLTWVVSHNV